MFRIVLPLLALAACAPALPAQTAEEKKATIEFVRKLQTNTGGFLSMEPKPNIRLAPNLKATSSALRALHYLGGEVPNKKAAIEYVESCWNEEKGGFSNFPRGEPDVFVTAVGVMAAKELGLPLDKYKAKAIAYFEKNAKTFEEIRIAAAGLERLEAKVEKKVGDTWNETVSKTFKGKYEALLNQEPGVAREWASGFVTLLRLGRILEGDQDGPAKALTKGQAKDGGYLKASSKASDLETSYRVMRAFHMMKSSPDANKMRAFVASCRNADGGYGTSPGEDSTVGGTYFAAIILHWLKDK